MDEQQVKALISGAIAEAVGDGGAIAAAVSERIGSLGTDLTNKVAEQIRDGLAQAVEALPKPKDGLTADQVKAAITEQLAADKKAAEEAAKAGQANEAAKAKVKAYIAEKMADVPAAYLGGMPETVETDEALAAAEQTVRATLRADMDKLGVKAPDLGGQAAGGGAGAGGVSDAEKSGGQLLKEAYAEENAG